MSFNLDDFVQGPDGRYTKKKETTSKVKSKGGTSRFDPPKQGTRSVMVKTSAKKTKQVFVPDDVVVTISSMQMRDIRTMRGVPMSFSTATFKIENVTAVPAQRLNGQTAKLLHIDDDKLISPDGKDKGLNKKRAIQRYFNMKAIMAFAYNEMGRLLQGPNMSLQLRPRPDYIAIHAAKEMPKSWTIGTKDRHRDQLRKQKPDWDNEAKAVQDGLFDEDDAIAIGHMEQTWADQSFVLIEMEVERLQKL